MKNIELEYEKDFYAWTVHNAELLREGKLSEIDAINIAEEIESMGKREKRELINRLAILMSHLLKWRYQSKRRTRSWQLTIKEQRRQFKRLLNENPSLKHKLESSLKEAYEDAVIMAEQETKLEEATFPQVCPFSLRQILDFDYFLE